MSKLLTIDHLTKKFGGLLALNDISFEVEKDHVVGLIGPNGAGKSTLFEVISGFHKPNGGKVFLSGERIDGLEPHDVVERGLARSFQHTEIFPANTVFETVLTAALFSLPMREAQEHSKELLKFIGLSHYSDVLVCNLSYGWQRTVALAVALATGPRLMMLDEPVTALNPKRAMAMVDLIRKIRDRGTTIILVEHNMKAIFNVCDQIVVLESGRKLAEGTAEEIRENPEVIRAYLEGIKNV
jgi:branched-chain amino acid transport system ATP-binding protein